MRNRDLWSSLFWFIVGLGFCIGATKYGIMASGIPGAGFFPFLGGIVLTSLSFIVLISAWTMKEKREGFDPEVKIFPKKDGGKKVLLSALALYGYIIAIQYLGAIVTTFIFMTFLLRFIEPKRWTTVLVVSLLSSAGCYIIFERLLEINLPKGIVGP